MCAAASTQGSKNDEAISAICGLDWPHLTPQDIVSVAWSYYYFSIQFRENLCLACAAFPDDESLKRLFTEECNTSNLSPYPGIAAPGEKMNHDEFMARTLGLFEIPASVRDSYQAAGERYLAQIRAVDPAVRATSMASYEDGGLEAVFKAMLRSPESDNELIRAFRFFLSEHIRFDSDPDAGHGSLSRHIEADDNVAELWDLYRQLLSETTPSLFAQHARAPSRELAQA